MSSSQDILYACRQAIDTKFDYLVVWAEPNSDKIQYRAAHIENVEEVVAELGKRALEVYDLWLPRGPQIAASRAWNMPTSTSSLPEPCEPVELPVEPSI